MKPAKSAAKKAAVPSKKTVKALKHNPENPRVITDSKLAQLDASMREYGDLSGIVFNRRSGNVVGGTQRTKNLSPDAKVVITKNLARTKQGTVAWGYVEQDGERWSYREVDWTAAKEKGANLAANKNAGEWDQKRLGDWFKDLGSFDVDFDLNLTMFDETERLKFLPKKKGSDDDESAPAEKESASKLVHECPRCGHEFR